VPAVIRAATVADRPGLLRLFEVAFAQAASPEDWAWKYDRVPHRAVSAIAVDGDEVVGFYGGLGTRYRGSGGDLPGVAAIDVMTSPAHRGLTHRSVFQELVGGFVSLNAAAGVPFYFGFPNARHSIVSKRLVGSWPVEPAGLLARPVGAPFLTSRLRRRLLRARPGEPFGAAHDRLAGALHARTGWRTDRSAATLRWRFTERPGVDYVTLPLVDLAGRSPAYGVLRFVLDRALFVDLQTADESSGALVELLERARELAAARGATRLELRLPGSSSLAARLRSELGFAEAVADAHFEVMRVDPSFPLEAAARSFDYRYLDHEIF